MCEMGQKLPNNIRLKTIWQHRKKIADFYGYVYYTLLQIRQRPLCPQDTKVLVLVDKN